MRFEGKFADNLDEKKAICVGRVVHDNRAGLNTRVYNKIISYVRRPIQRYSLISIISLRTCVRVHIYYYVIPVFDMLMSKKKRKKEKEIVHVLLIARNVNALYNDRRSKHSCARIIIQCYDVY